MQRVQQPGRRQRAGGPQRGRSDTLPYREAPQTQNAEQLAASRRVSGAAATTSGRRQPPQRAVQRPRQQRPMIQAAVNSNKPRDWKVTADAVRALAVCEAYDAPGAGAQHACGTSVSRFCTSMRRCCPRNIRKHCHQFP